MENTTDESQGVGHLTGIVNFRNICKELGFLDTGSSSINPKYSKFCTEIREWMSGNFGISQVTIPWHLMGDLSGVLYMSGFQTKHDTGEITKIVPHEYLSLFLSDHSGLSKETVSFFNDLCQHFYEMELYLLSRDKSKN